MFSTKLIAFVAALMAQEAVALNAHRHAHNDFHGKRDVVYVNDVVTVTDWTTVTVYDDGAPAPTSPPKMYKDNHTIASTGFSSSANSTSSTATSSSFSTSSSSFSSSSSILSSSSSIFSSSPSPSTSSASSSLYKTGSLTPIYPPTTLVTSTKVSSSYPVATPSTIAAVQVDAGANGAVSFSTSSTPTPTVNGFDSFTSAAGAAISSVVAVVTSAIAIPAATTSSAAATTTAASSSSGGSGKRGLAYNDGSLLSIFLNSGSKVSWSYNWGQTAASDATSDVEFIPMLWSPNDASTWPDAVDSAISSGTTALLSFNEPDNSGQCNLDAVSAAAAHITHMNPYSGKAKIGAPAITNSGNAGEGINWLNSFISACDGQCAIDFCPLHWYNVPDADEFLEHVSNVHAACGKPVWITEFAPISGSDSDIATFLQTVMTALDSDEYSYVERYSYFMAATGSLLTSSTSLSTYGETFAYY